MQTQSAAVLVSLLLSSLLAGCVTSHFVPNRGADQIVGGVQVLFEYPKTEYTDLGLLDVGYYRPGWTAPALNDAMPKVSEQVRAAGGNAVIIRGERPGQVASRSIIVSAEVLRVP
jgi:hypothetical protein